MREDLNALRIFQRALAALALSLGATSVLATPIVVVNQTRSLLTNASTSLGTPDADSLVPVGAGAFSISSSSSNPPGATVGSATGTAAQQANLGSSLISAIGSTQADLVLGIGTGGSVAAGGSSTYEVEFSLAASSSYSLSGTVDSQAIVTGGASIPQLDNQVQFLNLDTSIVLFETLTNDQTFLVNGLLGPGNYRLRALATIVASQGYGEVPRSVTGVSSFSFDFAVQSSSVPEPASIPLILTASVLILIGRLARSRTRAQLAVR